MPAESISEESTASPAPAPAATGFDNLEGQTNRGGETTQEPVSAFKAVGWLEPFLPGWIIVAMFGGALLASELPASGPS